MKKDYDVLKKLAYEYKNFSENKRNAENILLWKAMNSLKPIRPMVMIDQLPWGEFHSEELALQCEDPYSRLIETKFRQTLFKWKYFPCDMVIDPYFSFPLPWRGSVCGMVNKEQVMDTDPNNDVKSHYYLDQLQNEEDIEKIQYQAPWIVEEEKEHIQEIVDKSFGDFLEFRFSGYDFFYYVMDLIGSLHGVENVYYDLADRPEFIHRLAKKLSENFLRFVNDMEKIGLITYHMEVVHCSGGYYDWKDEPVEPGKKLNAKNTWGFGSAQIFSACSLATHEEFEQYSIPFYEKFGLVNYGCCEPLDRKISFIRKIPNVRKISISPWADVKTAAEQIGGDYIITNKPNPSCFVSDNFDAVQLMPEMEKRIQICKETGTPIEFIMKDISSVRYKVDRLISWEKEIMKVVQKNM